MKHQMTKAELNYWLMVQQITEPPPEDNQVLLVTFPRPAVLRHLGQPAMMQVTKKGHDNYEMKEIP